MFTKDACFSIVQTHLLISVILQANYNSYSKNGYECEDVRAQQTLFYNTNSSTIKQCD